MEGTMIWLNNKSRKLENNFNKNVTHVITDSGWDDIFDEQLEDNPKLLILKSSFVTKSHEAQKAVAYQKHVVVGIS